MKSVASPLLFFALVAVLYILYMALGMLLFVMFVIVVVALLMVFSPKKLVFDQETHLALLREGLGDSELPTPYGPRELPKIEATREIADKGDA